MRIRIGSPLTKTNKRLAVLGTAALALSMSIAPNASAQDVRSTVAPEYNFLFLPDYNPWIESPVSWIFGEATGKWNEGIPLVGTGVESLYLSLEPETNLSDYLSLGNVLCGGDTNEGTCSDQLVGVTPGEVWLKVFDNASPQTVFDAVVIDAPPLADGELFTLTAYEVTGPDAAFFDLDLFTAIASDGLTPGSDEDASVAFDLIFNPDGLDLAGQTDFAATITFTADTGLEIPVNVSATTVPEPASLALGVLGWVGLMSRRSRRA